MPNFITTSIQWDGKETTDVFLKPSWAGEDPLMSGIRVIPNVQSKLKLNYLSAKNKILKAYTKGFNGASGATYTQRNLEVTELKAEMAQDAYEFAQTVFEQVLGKGVDWNNLEAAAPAVRDSIIAVFQNGVKQDIFRKFWLNDTAKETLSGGLRTGTADTDYNEFDGVWKLIMSNAATSPTGDEIKRISLNSSTYLNTVAVAQVDTITLSGSSGTATVTIDGRTYTATYATSLTQTAANFVNTHETALAARNITVTSSGADIILTSSATGMPFSSSIANASGTLDGTRVNTTTNTAMGSIKSGGAKAMLKAIYEGANKELKALPAIQKRLYVTDSIYESYLIDLESDGTEASHMKLVDGVERLTYRGIPVIPMGWNVYLEADSIEQYSTPHRIIYALPENLVLGLDAVSDFTKSEFWYNQDEQENRFRIQLKMGAQYVHNEFISVGY